MAEIVVTGATGQVGTALVPALRGRHGAESVLAVGLRRRPAEPVRDGP